MVKRQVTFMIDDKVLRRVEEIRREEFPGASRSFVIEFLIRRGLTTYRGDISVTK